MKQVTSKTKMKTTFAIVLLIASVTIMAMPVQAQAQRQDGKPLPPGVTPAYTVNTRAFLSFRPNPVGVGQTILVNIWTNPATHASRCHTSYVVTITKPDGTKVTVGPLKSFYADATAWFEYVVDQIGTWKVKFEFGGSYFPAATVIGGWNEPTEAIGECYYTPSSTAEQELTVQEAQVLSWPPSPLPTDYWTRPVAFEHREWGAILGDFPWNGPGGGSNWPADTNIYWSDRENFVPYVQAPNTAHIVWKRQGAISGLMGENLEQRSWTTGGGNPTIIFQGRCYQTLTKVVDGIPQSIWQCYGLRTGQVYWERTGVTAPTVIEYTEGASVVPGGDAGNGITPRLLAIAGAPVNRLIKYDPWTGAVVLNVSIPSFLAPSQGASAYMNEYVLSVQDIGTTAAPSYRLINWTTKGTAANFAARIMNNISWPWMGITGSLWQWTTQTAGLHMRSWSFDYNAGVAVQVDFLTPPEVGAWVKTNIQAASLTTGELLWNITVDKGGYNNACVIADHGKVAFLTQDGKWLAYDLLSGKLAWESETMDYPADATGWGSYTTQSAYGLFYRQAYSGVYAFDWDTGKIVWKYKDPANPYETPYTDETGQTANSFGPLSGLGVVADGKLYVSNGEHTSSQPITRGWKLHCINATTGEGIWNITLAGDAAPVADGYLSLSSMDGYQYVFGKGKSATTITAPDVSVPIGTNLVIKGTVLDMSPGQPNTPCVSKESMTTQMEYLHRQMPIDGIWHNVTITGVPVALTAIGADGSSIDLGTVTTDGYYGMFSKTWAPDKKGDYTIMASFAADDSYGSSAASTSLSIVAAPEQISIPEQITPPDYTMAIISSAIAVIIAVAIVGILLYRKKP